MNEELLPVIGSGLTIDEDGVQRPTVVIDASDRPDVSDLARVHAMEGMGDIRTEAQRIDGDEMILLLLGVRMTSPVQATFVMAMDLEEHRTVLEQAAEFGSLVIAHTPPERAAVDEPSWLSIDLDPDQFRAQLS